MMMLNLVVEEPKRNKWEEDKEPWTVRWNREPRRNLKIALKTKIFLIYTYFKVSRLVFSIKRRSLRSLRTFGRSRYWRSWLIGGPMVKSLYQVLYRIHKNKTFRQGIFIFIRILQLKLLTSRLGRFRHFRFPKTFP